MLTWAHFWYTQYVIITSIGSFFVFKGFFDFPWAWIGTVLLQYRFPLNRRNMFKSVFFNTLVISVFQNICQGLEAKWVAVVAAGFNSIPVVSAYLGCILYGYAHERLLSVGTIKNFVSFAFVHVVWMRLVFALGDVDDNDVELQEYCEVWIYGLSGLVLLQYGVYCRQLHFRLEILREVDEFIDRRRLNHFRPQMARAQQNPQP